MTIYFKCGCFFAVETLKDSGREIGGLACCTKHEKPYAQLEELGELEVKNVKFKDAWGDDD